MWFDRVSMPSSQLTVHQETRDAIAVRDFLLLVLVPTASSSDYFAHECILPTSRLISA